MEKQSFDGTSLLIEDIKVGGGAEVVSGNTVSVHYTGWLLDGTKFDSSLDRGQPFSFNVGGGRVIAGWEQGLLGMKVGGKRKLTIPARLGYGVYGVPGVIPANSALVFDIELLKVE
ncbi:MAG: FKBP-type peptidyl-prolyl cis-trans isomerase [Patescibacteria group bacterium]